MTTPTAPAATIGGRYRSLFVVGRGGMGSVEAAAVANGEGAFERVVALKRLLPDAARDRRRVDMFLREARLASLLDHPNVVTAYDYGEAEGELYLAMEYVEGQPLSLLLKALAQAQVKLPVDVVAHLLAEVCRGLHAAHDLADPTTGQALNLVHRDVSPQNVMIGYDGRVRLLDFGVAKIETESQTKTGEVKGKTAYMSPEQAMGDPLDRRSDLFGVGALLFECLALSRMWGDGTDMEMIRKLALEQPPKLDATKRDDLPADLSALYTRLVAREHDARPATAADVATSLDTLVPDAEASTRALRALMDAHFAGEAAEQRKRLKASLEELAPQQAEALRESLHPSMRPAAPVAPAAVPVERGSEPESEVPSPAPARSRVGYAVAGAAVVAIVAWRMLGTHADPPRPDPTPAVTSAAMPALPATTAPPATVATPPSTASAPATAALPTASAPKANVAAPTPAPKPAQASSAAAAPSPAPRPSAKPPDVDDHPF